MNFRYKLEQFFYGRYITYGIDFLSKVLAVLCIIFAVINIFLSSIIIYLMQTFLLIYMFYRLLSRNIYKRQKENRFFLQYKDKITDFISLQKRKNSDRQTHVYKKCPHCSVVLRLPKKPGKHTVKCPRCKNDFTVKVR